MNLKRNLKWMIRPPGLSSAATRTVLAGAEAAND